MSTVWLDAPDFTTKGGWQLETQFVREMEQPYLLANDEPGKPVQNAAAEFSVKQQGNYRVFVRTKNWKPADSPGRFQIKVDETLLPTVCGTRPTHRWHWDIAGDVLLSPGRHTVFLQDLTGWLSRAAAVVITDDMDFFPAEETELFLRQRAEIKGLCPAAVPCNRFDFVVVGGGPGGVPAAVAAARKGLKVALIQDRPNLGGNASDDGTVGLDGAGGPNHGAQETGIASEIKNIKHHCSVTWQGAMERLVAAEPNITVFTNTLCRGAKTARGKICEITCVNTLTLAQSRFSAPLFADCTGDSWLAYYAGAKYRMGREGRHEHGESVAPDSGDSMTMSGCLRGRLHGQSYTGFYAKDTGHPVSFTAPDFATRLPRGKALGRTAKALHTADWWLELPNDYDDLFDAEHTRDALFCLTLGYFDWLKNSSNLKKQAENYELEKVSTFLAKRESRRVIGDYVLSFNDFNCNRMFPDAVSYCGWNIDLHHVKGIFSGAEGAFFSNHHVAPTPIPYRCLYSCNVQNLFLASRGISVTHTALGSTRVESTIATLGQVVGTAAFFCKKYSLSPREVGQKHMAALQQQLLLDDLTVPNTENTDPHDLARGCPAVATQETTSEQVTVFDKTYHFKPAAALVTNGQLRDLPGCSNAWYTAGKLPQSITVTLPRETTVGALQITTDTDLFHPLYSYWEFKPFGSTVTSLQAALLVDGIWQTVGEIKGNYQRQMRLSFPPKTAAAVRITVLDSVDHQTAKLFEVRAYPLADYFLKID